MAIRKQEEVEKFLEKNRPGFFGGIWLCMVVFAKFAWSVINPNNWSLTRIVESERKIVPEDSPRGESARNEGKLLK